jgi:hypothetical protein
MQVVMALNGSVAGAVENQRKAAIFCALAWRMFSCPVTFSDRVFIFPEIGDMNITRTWALVISAFRRGDVSDANSRFHDVTADIVISALKKSE